MKKTNRFCFSLILFVSAALPVRADEAPKIDDKNTLQATELKDENHRVYELTMEQAILEKIRYASSQQKPLPNTASVLSIEENPLADLHHDYNADVQKIFESLY